MEFIPYRREDAAAYAHYWAYRRNPAYYDYSDIGGDCTNFASQCIFAGTGRMNYTQDYGWYYIGSGQKAPAWTGVEYLKNFLVRDMPSPGPVAEVTKELSIARPGDVIQLLFTGDVFQHSPVVVCTDGSGDPSHIRIAAHSSDADCRPLDSYAYQKYRVLHVLGYYN